ncbi:hypothetical protein [Sorangium sp. So ce426]|uniref:hypothetical protein n=1 Tax=unclassified Sorangium TaxID=2621164 RepID=UPI003F5BA3FC
MAALPDGEVLAVERWAPGRADSMVIPLPAWDGKLLRATVLATERDRYVVARFEAASTLARNGGQRMLGASAPDAARAEALAVHLRERVKGASPAVACFTPAEVLREVRLAGAP